MSVSLTTTCQYETNHAVPLSLLLFKYMESTVSVVERLTYRFIWLAEQIVQYNYRRTVSSFLYLLVRTVESTVRISMSTLTMLFCIDIDMGYGIQLQSKELKGTLYVSKCTTTPLYCILR